MSAREPNGVDYSTASSSAAFTATQQPVSMYRTESGAVGGEDDQAASSSTMEHENATAGKLKNKKRQPKYRATKRPPSERRFQCDHCESRFFTQKDVKRHLVVHTGVRNFACPYCTQRFGRKDHLVRHAKKSHDQDTRSFKRRARQASLGASSSATEPTAKKPSTRKGSSRSRRKTGDAGRDQHFEPSTSASNSILTTTSITSPSTSYYLHDNGFNNSLNRAAAATSTHPHFSNSTIMLSSTSTSPLTPFPKMTLVDVHSSTSTLTASLTHPRSYHSSFNYETSTSAAASSNFNYNINGAPTAVATFNQFLPPPTDGSASGSQYALQLPAPPAGNAYLNYDYKPPPSNSSLNYPGSSSSHHEAFNSGHLTGAVSGHSNGAGNLSFKTITAEGFNNTCIELEYSAAAAAAAGMASAFGSTSSPLSSSSVPFGDSGGQHGATRFHSPFN